MAVQRLFWSAAVVCAAALLCVTASAQGPGGGPDGGPGAGVPNGPLSPEQMGKAWEAQAAYVAKDLSFNGEQSKKLTDAYKAVRESFIKPSLDALGGRSGGPGGPGGEAFQKVATEERAKLQAALKGFLDEDQTTKAMATLGILSIRWDMMTSSLIELGLEDKAKADAMRAVTSYNVEASTLPEAAGGDRDAMRAKSTELRQKLEADLGKILSADQLTKLKEMPGFHRGRRSRGSDGSGGADAAAAKTEEKK